MPLPPMQGPPTRAEWEAGQVRAKWLDLRERGKKRREWRRLCRENPDTVFGMFLALAIFALHGHRIKERAEGPLSITGAPGRGIRPGQLPAQQIASSGDGLPYK